LLFCTGGEKREAATGRAMDNLKFTDGLIPAIVRDAKSGAILTLAYMNEESLKKTEETGETWFWSRSRNELWHKGATSGNTQRVVHIATDCDRDALVVSVEPAGPACHTGADSCFAHVPSPALDLERLMKVLRSRHAERPEQSYSTYLFNEGRDKILKKIGEEATEVVIAAKGQGRERMTSEIADLLFHLSVLLVDEGLEWSDVGSELEKRAR
jgi:phosphoribosyl-AMP cyclohydrolase / phosphoribosyl-ATP pyrophosphohydrolase